MVYAPATRRSTCRVRRCANTTPPGMVVCGDCADSLVRDLLIVPGLALALESAHTKSLRFGASTPSRAPVPSSQDQEESPLPFNPKASETSALLLDTLTRWADLVAHQRGYFRPLNTVPVLARWLAQQVVWLRSAEIGPEAVQRIRAVIRRSLHVVDRPADRLYAGPCDATVEVEVPPTTTEPAPDAAQQPTTVSVPCGADLYAEAGDLAATCTSCGKVFPLAERRKWLLGEAEDMLLPATELARAIDGLGADVTPHMIRVWKDRGRLVPHGSTSTGRPLYRVGDVMDLVNAAALRAATKGRHRVDA